MSYLLSLDLSSHVGWTRGHPEDRHFAFGTYTLPKTGDNIGAFLQAYERWLVEALESVSLCTFEEPILPRKTKYMTLRKLYGLASTTELICADFGIKCRGISAMKIKAFMGSGSYGKPEMMAAVQRAGFDPQDHNAADAISLRLLILHQLYPKSHGFDMRLGALGGTM